MKNAEEVLNEILKEHSIEIGGLEFIDKDSCLKAMKLYANAKLEEASEIAENGRKKNIKIQSGKENNQDVIYLEGKIKAYKELIEVASLLKDQI